MFWVEWSRCRTQPSIWKCGLQRNAQPAIIHYHKLCRADVFFPQVLHPLEWAIEYVGIILSPSHGCHGSDANICRIRTPSTTFGRIKQPFGTSVRCWCLYAVANRHFPSSAIKYQNLILIIHQKLFVTEPVVLLRMVLAIFYSNRSKPPKDVWNMKQEHQQDERNFFALHSELWYDFVSFLFLIFLSTN